MMSRSEIISELAKVAFATKDSQKDVRAIIEKAIREIELQNAKNYLERYRKYEFKVTPIEE